MNRKLSIKAYSELAAASLRKRRDQGLFLWLLARAMDGDGRGFVLKKAFMTELVQRGLFNVKTLQHLMSHEGRDVFWAEVVWKDQEGKRHRALRYKGLKKVAGELQCCDRSGPVDIPEQKMGKTLHERRAVLASVASGAPEGQWMNPRSRKFLEQHIGREQSTQRRYEKSAGVRVVFNYYRDYTDPLRPLAKQLPNCRYYQFKKLKMGQGRKLRQSKALRTVGRVTSRSYFATEDEAVKYMRTRNSNLECAYVLQNSLRESPAKYVRLFWDTFCRSDVPKVHIAASKSPTLYGGK